MSPHKTPLEGLYWFRIHLFSPLCFFSITVYRYLQNYVKVADPGLTRDLVGRLIISILGIPPYISLTLLTEQ